MSQDLLDTFTTGRLAELVLDTEFVQSVNVLSLPEEHDRLGITAELSNVLLNPLKSQTLVEETAVLAPESDFRRVGESKD